jgi:outer membrane protein
MSLGGSVSWASGGYASTHFGVNAADSAASGLAAYSPTGGVKDVGIDATLTYVVDENWSVSGVASVSQLLGDFADSPVVDQRGSATQAAALLVVNRTF